MNRLGFSKVGVLKLKNLNEDGRVFFVGSLIYHYQTLTDNKSAPLEDVVCIKLIGVLGRKSRSFGVIRAY